MGSSEFVAQRTLLPCYVRTLQAGLSSTPGSMAKWLMLQCRFTQQSLFDAYHRCALISQLLEPDVACCLRLRLLRACRKYWLEAKESTKFTYRSCLQAWIRFIEWRRSLGHWAIQTTFACIQTPRQAFSSAVWQLSHPSNH
jgi:hypothetical protein